MAEVDRILIVGGRHRRPLRGEALQRQGFASELVERSLSWPAVGAGIALRANGVRVLRTLALGEAIDRAAAIIPRWQFLDQQGDLLCETDLQEFWHGVGPAWGSRVSDCKRYY